MRRKSTVLLLLKALIVGTVESIGQDKPDSKPFRPSFNSNLKHPSRKEVQSEDATKSNQREGVLDEDHDAEESVTAVHHRADDEEGLILPLGTRHSPARRRRSARDWSKVDLDEVEEEWRGGDDEEELITPDEELYRLSERRREEAMEKLNEVMAEGAPGGSGKIMNTDRFERLAEEAQHAGKPGMIFAKVRDDVLPRSVTRSEAPEEMNDNTGEIGSGWDWDSLSGLCQEWRHQLEFKMVDITCYPMESEMSILVTVQKGWNSRDVFDYLAWQGNVLSEITWNDRKLRPRKLEDEDDELFEL